ncbi:MAG: TIGR02678 family protein [Pirellulales bacterium]|nr:TIGR02678 family protein [Pirellulales bacterium]
MSTDEGTYSGADSAFRGLFANRVGIARAREILNVLMESPFFYRDDDLDLFETLRRRRSVFADFFQSFYGWELYVDTQVARLIKPKVYNSELNPTQRHIFRLSGRNEFVLFVLLLEFHQRQADEQNLDLETCDEVRFVLGDFIEFAFRRYRDELSDDDSVPEDKLFDHCRALFTKLELYRFIAVRQREGEVKEKGLRYGFTRTGKDDVLYALLPGLRCYRAEALNQLDFDPKAVVDGDVSDPAKSDTAELADTEWTQLSAQVTELDENKDE